MEEAVPEDAADEAANMAAAFDVFGSDDDDDPPAKAPEPEKKVEEEK